MGKRKIIEIYVEENEDITSFDFIKVEDSDIANETMRALVQIFSVFKDKEDELEVVVEDE